MKRKVKGKHFTNLSIEYFILKDFSINRIKLYDIFKIRAAKLFIYYLAYHQMVQIHSRANYRSRSIRNLIIIGTQIKDKKNNSDDREFRFPVK